MFHTDCECFAARGMQHASDLAAVTLAHDQHAPEASDCVLKAIARISYQLGISLCSREH